MGRHQEPDFENFTSPTPPTLDFIIRDFEIVLNDKPKSKQQEHPLSDTVNRSYMDEIKNYRNAPKASCTKQAALKLLKQFSKKDFRDFWLTSVDKYLPAVSEGTMKLAENIYSHDTANAYAKSLIKTLSPIELAKDFLYGIANNAPEYRTALPAYYYIKNLPEHEFEKKFVGQAPDKNGIMVDRYAPRKCAICGYDHEISNEPKMRFWHINVDMEFFYFKGRMGRSSLNTAIVYLEEYKKLPRPSHSTSDLDLFRQIVEVIENSPQDTTPATLRKELKKSGLTTMTHDQLEVFINTLGYLDILHPEDSHGMLYTHTLERDMLPAHSFQTYNEHPVNRWKRSDGIDYGSISLLFDGIYDSK